MAVFDGTGISSNSQMLGAVLMEQLGMDLHMSSGDVVKLVLGIITFGGVCITAWFSFRGQREARGANRAVNGNTDGTIRLYDLAVKHQKDLDVLTGWMQSYQGGPLDKGHKVEIFVEEHNDFVKQASDNFCLVHKELKCIDEELHIVNEKVTNIANDSQRMVEKHGCPFSLGKLPICGRDPAEIIEALDEAKEEVRRRLIDEEKPDAES